MFRTVRRHSPNDEQLAVVQAYYDAQLAHYRADPKAARSRVQIGITPVDARINPAALAAMTDAATLVMAAPASYFIQ
jgi:hypothetical protein